MSQFTKTRIMKYYIILMFLRELFSESVREKSILVR